MTVPNNRADFQARGTTPDVDPASTPQTQALYLPSEES